MPLSTLTCLPDAAAAVLVCIGAGGRCQSVGQKRLTRPFFGYQKNGQTVGGGQARSEEEGRDEGRSSRKEAETTEREEEGET